MNSTVAVLKTSPATVLDDYGRLMRMAGYRDFIDIGQDTLVKLNLSWTKFYPACSSQPWQLEGVLRILIQDGFDRSKIFPVENKTVVTRPKQGAKNNLWLGVLRDYQLEFVPLTEVNWSVYRFKSDFLKIHEIFPEGIEIPLIYRGKQVIHLPTVKTHGHSVTTGAIKNSFGGLLKETRHHAHRFIHEVLVDLMMMQKELHPGIFAVVDGTVCGNGAGPRTMSPEVKNYLLAGADQVAVDAVAAKMMGFDPLKIGYLRMCHEREIGIADPDRIQVIGEDVSDVNFGFRVRRPPVIAGDQIIRRGFLRPLEKVLLRSALAGFFLLSAAFGCILLAYLVLNAAYNLLFKKIAILDTLWVAFSLLLRAFAGATLACAPMSLWLIGCTLALGLFMSFAKRRNELHLLGAKAAAHRQSLKWYKPGRLDWFLYASAAAVVVGYASYTFCSETALQIGNGSVALTIPLVLFGVMRFFYLLNRDSEASDPTGLLIEDRLLLTNSLLWSISVILIIYGKFIR